MDKTERFDSVIIENVTPSISHGRFHAKKTIGERFELSADIFAEGHQSIDADFLYRREGEKEWKRKPLQPIEKDLWKSHFLPKETGIYEYTIEAWVHEFATWFHDLKKRIDSNQKKLEVDIEIGAQIVAKSLHTMTEEEKKIAEAWIEELEKKGANSTHLQDEAILKVMRSYSHHRTRYEKIFRLEVSRKRSGFSSWYELFPRSHGGFKGSIQELPRIAKMGFNVLYLPPIHPIGITHRKGKNNHTVASEGDPGSPWGIGSSEGGHDAIHAELGTLEDFHELMDAAKGHGIEIALDLAFQCSPDHPYVKEHPEWFNWRPDGTVQFAENPPKKYQDIIPFHFDNPEWKALWEELRRVVFYWMDQGVLLFRVDNPHTKPFAFWEWLIAECKQKNPNVLFLSEAFTRPKVMKYLSKIGFDQSYTYFTWKNSKEEITRYMQELTQSEMREFYRPNFWPNTPDILPEHLQKGGKAAFISRLVMAATLSSNYGIYGPAFEYCVSKPLEEGSEEYWHSEKYEVKDWKAKGYDSIEEVIVQVNAIRNRYSALQTTWNLHFHEIDNEYLLCYSKESLDKGPTLLIVVSLDFFKCQSGQITFSEKWQGILEEHQYMVENLLTGEKITWTGLQNNIEIDPQVTPALIFALYPQTHSEKECDFYDEGTVCSGIKMQ